MLGRTLWQATRACCCFRRPARSRIWTAPFSAGCCAVRAVTGRRSSAIRWNWRKPVDSAQYGRTVYRASNWMLVGRSAGPSRGRDGYTDPHGKPGEMHVYPSRRSSVARLCAAESHPDREVASQSVDATEDTLQSLLKELQRVPHFRQAPGAAAQAVHGAGRLRAGTAGGQGRRRRDLALRARHVAGVSCGAGCPAGAPQRALHPAVAVDDLPGDHAGRQRRSAGCSQPLDAGASAPGSRGTGGGRQEDQRREPQRERASRNRDAGHPCARVAGGLPDVP